MKTCRRFKAGGIVIVKENDFLSYDGGKKGEADIKVIIAMLRVAKELKWWEKNPIVKYGVLDESNKECEFKKVYSEKISKHCFQKLGDALLSPKVLTEEAFVIIQLIDTIDKMPFKELEPLDSFEILDSGEKVSEPMLPVYSCKI